MLSQKIKIFDIPGSDHIGDQIDVPKGYKACLLYCVYLDPSTPKGIRANILVTFRFATQKLAGGELPDAALVDDLLDETLHIARPFIQFEHKLLSMSLAEEV